jgi:hypothetical protein
MSWEEEIEGEEEDKRSKVGRVETNAGGEVWETEPVVKCRFEYAPDIFLSQLNNAD